MTESTYDPSVQTNSTRIWDVFCHLAALSFYVGVPFGNIVGPLIIWLIKRGDLQSVDEHGKESLNFQISFTLWSVLLFVVGGGITVALMFVLVGFLLLPVLIAMAILVPLLNVVLVIVGGVKVFL
jgi:hypothetical protein